MRAFLLMTVMGMLTTAILYTLRFSSQQKRQEQIKRENPGISAELDRLAKKQACFERCDEESAGETTPDKRLACRRVCFAEDHARQAADEQAGATRGASPGGGGGAEEILGNAMKDAPPEPAEEEAPAPPRPAARRMAMPER